MSDDLRAKFRDRFIAVAQERVKLGIQNLSDQGDAAVVRAELHSLAGEAALIGFDDIANTARTGEAAAEEWVERGEASSQLACARVLRQLARTLRQLEGESASETGDAARPSQNAERRVLIVDDSAIVADQVGEALGDAGLEVRVASDLSSALEAASTFAPDLALVDVTIPGVDSTDLCLRLADAFAPKKVPILLLSGLSDEELEVRARSAGAQGHISKRHGLAAVVDGVRAALEGTTP